MDFNLTKEQEQLSDTVQKFVARQYPFELRKNILKSKDGFSREIWAGLAELGLLGLEVPEEHGGIGAGAIETLLTMTAFGRGLLVEPFLPSAILSTVLIRELATHLWGRMRTAVANVARLGDSLPPPDRDSLTRNPF